MDTLQPWIPKSAAAIMHRFPLKQHENILFWPTSPDRLGRVRPKQTQERKFQHLFDTAEYDLRSGILSYRVSVEVFTNIFPASEKHTTWCTRIYFRDHITRNWGYKWLLQIQGFMFVTCQFWNVLKIEYTCVMVIL